MFLTNCKYIAMCFFVASTLSAGVMAQEQQVGDFGQLRGYFEQALDEGQSGYAITFGQKAIMSDSDKALWQSVEQKPVDKFNGADCGLLYNIVLTIFIP